MPKHRRAKRRAKLTPRQSQLVRQIQRIHLKGQPLNIAAVKRRHPTLMERVYAVKPYWGWKQALADAGIDYREIKIELEPYATCPICGEQMRLLSPHIAGVHDYDMGDFKADYPGTEIASEERRAEMMRQCLRSGKACLLVPHWEPLWSDEYVLDRIVELRRLGFDINCKAAFDGDRVFAQARKRFGSWDAALQRAGLEPSEIRRQVPPRDWNARRVVSEITRRHREGLPLYAQAVEVGDHRDVELLWKGRQFFGSWEKAIRAVKIDYEAVRWRPVRKYPTPESVLKEIRRRKKAGEPLSLSRVKAPGGDSNLRHRASEYFGGWRQAVEAAGYPNRSPCQCLPFADTLTPA